MKTPSNRPTDLRRFGQVIREAREENALSIRKAAEAIGIGKTLLSELEQGVASSPSPAVMEAMSETYGLPLIELYEAAGYEIPQGLPSFVPYLRSRYKGLPKEAQQELEKTFKDIAKKYGVDPKGPMPGEDE